MVKKKGKEVEVEEKIVYPLQYKSNLEAIGRLISSLTFTNAQLDKLKRTPFWHIFKQWIGKEPSVKLRKTDENICAIIRKYDANEGAFMLAKKKVRLTDHDISLIFGVSCGNELMDLSKTSKPVHISFVSGRFEEEKILKSKNIKAALAKAMTGNSEEDTDDVARLLTLYICLTLFFSTSGDTLSWAFIKYVVNVAEMRNYNWSRAIASHLMESVKKYVNNPVKVTGCVCAGCVCALTYWFCEHTTVFKPVDQTEFPRFLKWNSKKWPRKDFDKIYIDSLKKSQVISAELKSTEIEEKLLANDYLSSDMPGLIQNPNISSVPSAEGENVGEDRNKIVGDELEAPMGNEIEGRKEGEGELDYRDDSCYECSGKNGRHYSTPEVSMELREQQRFDFSNNDAPNVESVVRQNEGEAIKELQITRNELEEALRLVKLKDHQYCLLKEELENCKASFDKESKEKEVIKIRAEDLELAIVETTRSKNQLSEELQNLRNEMAEKECSALYIAKEIDRSELTMEIDILKALNDEMQKEVESLKGVILEMGEKHGAVETKMQHPDEVNEVNEVNLLVKGDKEKLEEELVEKMDTTAAADQLTEEKRLLNDDCVRNKHSPIIRGRGRGRGRGNVRGRGRRITRGKGRAPLAQTPPSMINRLKKKERKETKHGDSDFDYEWGAKESTVRKNHPNQHKRPSRSNEETAIDVDGIPDIQMSKKPKPLPSRCNENKFILPEDKEKMLKVFSVATNDTIIWSGESTVSYIDAVAISGAGMASNSVIDAYAEILLLCKKETLEETQQDQLGKSIAFTSSSMAFLRLKNINAFQKNVTDRVIEVHDKYRYLLFPIHAKGNKHTADHWTLLVRDTWEGIWKHYNSLLPRIKTAKDPYMKDAIDFIYFYNSLMPEKYKCIPTGNFTMIDSPQQTAGSLDCGILVMYIMDHIFNNMDIPKDVTTDDVARFRSDILHDFLNDKGRSWNEDVYKLTTMLTSTTEQG